MKTDEDEAFEQIEKAQVMRKKIAKTYDDDVMCYRSEVIEEIARAIEKFEGAFGRDTVSSFASYIRGMK